MGARKWIVLIIFSSFSFLWRNADASPGLSHLDSGRPGCWALFRNGALSSEELRNLPEDCRAFRDDYFASIEITKKNPERFEAKLVEVLKDAKIAKAPYEAIFFASLLHSEALIKALKVRAEIEKKLKVPFSYANTALFRIENLDCQKDKRFSHPFYKEICNSNDSILTTFFTRGSK